MSRKSSKPPTKWKTLASEKNKDPILKTLKTIIKVKRGRKTFPKLRILEIASGNGRHITYFAQHMSKRIFWQPSDCDSLAISSIIAHIIEEKVQNVAPPVYIDISEPYTSWKPENEAQQIKMKPILEYKPDLFDCVLSINMTHVTSIECTQGLFSNSSKILKNGGLLILYGPFSQDGVIAPESNVAFHKMIQESEPSWGIRDVQRDLLPLAVENRMVLMETVDMPSNNLLLVWKKTVTD